jgi:hypothetical protein
MDARSRRNRVKLLVSAVTLSIVMVAAALAQRNYLRFDPLGSAPVEEARSRPAPQDRPVYGKPQIPVVEVAPPDVVAEPVEAAEKSEATPETEAAKADVPGDIMGFLERWRTSLVKGDLDTHTELYALRLEQFFRQKNVPRAAVRREKERLLRLYPSMDHYELRNVKVESMRGDRATVTFRKDWTASGGERRFAGSENQRLTLRRAGPTWQIVREEETKIHWVRRT